MTIEKNQSVKWKFFFPIPRKEDLSTDRSVLDKGTRRDYLSTEKKTGRCLVARVEQQQQEKRVWMEDGNGNKRAQRT